MYDPAIQLGKYPEGLGTFVHTKTCPQISGAASLTTTNMWKGPKYPSTAEWISNTQYGYRTDYCAAIKTEARTPGTARCSVRGTDPRGHVVWDSMSVKHPEQGKPQTGSGLVAGQGDGAGAGGIERRPV